MVPWEGRTVVGTWHAEREFDPSSAMTPEADVDDFLRDANGAFPWLRLRREEVTLVHRGLVPGTRTRDGRLTMRSHGAIVDHASDGVDGAVSIVGVKYTTGRGVAEKAVSLVLGKLGRPVTPSPGSTMRLPGAIDEPVDGAVPALRAAHPELGAAVAEHLVRSYGSEAATPVAQGFSPAGSSPAALSPVFPRYPVLVSEVLHAVRHEMALTLSDAVIRRLNLGSAGYPGDDVAEAVANVMAAELGWPRWRVEEEVGELRRCYLTQG